MRSGRFQKKEDEVLLVTHSEFEFAFSLFRASPYVRTLTFYCDLVDIWLGCWGSAVLHVVLVCFPNVPEHVCVLVSFFHHVLLLRVVLLRLCVAFFSP